MLKKSLIILSATSMLSLGALTNSAQAETEGVKESAVTYGANLDQSQKQQTENILDANNADKEYIVTSQDMANYVNEHYDTVYSSTYIEPKKFEHGVEVEIVTPENISNVTQAQYENAAITAGIQNANIKVGAVVKTLGYGALSGIYKAMEEQGVELNQNDMQAAQDETQALSDIKEQNQEVDDDVLNGSIADMKSQVADKHQNNENVSDDDIHNIVNDTLKDNGLDQTLTDNQKSQIETIVQNANNSSALQDDPNAYKQQTDKLKDKLGSAMDQAREKADKLHNDSQSEGGWWSDFKNFFKGLFS